MAFLSLQTYFYTTSHRVRTCVASKKKKNLQSEVSQGSVDHKKQFFFAPGQT